MISCYVFTTSIFNTYFIKSLHYNLNNKFYENIIFTSFTSIAKMSLPKFENARAGFKYEKKKLGINIRVGTLKFI